MKPEPRLNPLSLPTLTVTTLGSTRLATPASESGGRTAADAGVPLPAAPSTVPCPRLPRLAKTKPNAPPRPPASSAVIAATTNTRPSPRRGAVDGSASGSRGGPDDPTEGRITTADGESGSRHGSASASFHHGDRAPLPRRPPPWVPPFALAAAARPVALLVPVARAPGAPCQPAPSGCRQAEPSVTIGTFLSVPIQHPTNVPATGRRRHSPVPARAA